MANLGYMVKRMREKVTNNICDNELSYGMVYSALVDMGFFSNWEEDEFYIRPIDETEIKECVWNYWNAE